MGDIERQSLCEPSIFLTKAERQYS